MRVHDFPTDAEGKAIPYGIYDMARNEAWVSVGLDHDTPAFAVASIRLWWHRMGQAAYPDARILYITADAGGSNGYRSRAWKHELQQFADETGLTIHVSHFPPGTSKWNKIEHRLFCHITANWRGTPLTTFETIVDRIGNTRTEAGLRVHAALDTNPYLTSVKVTDAEMNSISLVRDEFHGDWNYKLVPGEVGNFISINVLRPQPVRVPPSFCVAPAPIGVGAGVPPMWFFSAASGGPAACAPIVCALAHASPSGPSGRAGFPRRLLLSAFVVRWLVASVDGGRPPGTARLGRVRAVVLRRAHAGQLLDGRTGPGDKFSKRFAHSSLFTQASGIRYALAGSATVGARSRRHAAHGRAGSPGSRRAAHIYLRPRAPVIGATTRTAATSWRRPGPTVSTRRPSATPAPSSSSATHPCAGCRRTP